MMATSLTLLLLLAFQADLIGAHNHKPPNNNNNNGNNAGKSFVELNPNYVSPHRSSSFVSSSHHAYRVNNLNGQDDFEEVYFSSYKALPSQQRESKRQQQSLIRSSNNNHNFSTSKSIGLISLARDCAALFPSLAATTTACVAVFGAWQVPSCTALLQNWCVASWYNLQHGRWPCLVLSAVSHMGFLHLLFNLVTLAGFGPAVQRALQSASLQPWPLWPLLLGSTLSGSMTFLVWQALTTTLKRYNNNNNGNGCMGLSSVTCALITVFGRMNPQAQLRLLIGGVLPVRLSGNQLWMVLLATSVGPMLLHLVLPRQQKQPYGGVAHAAHLGGSLFGLLYYELWTRRYRLAGRLAQWKQSFTRNRS